MESRMMVNHQIRFGGRFTDVLSETSRFRPYILISSGGISLSSATRLDTDAIESHEISFGSWYALFDGR
jgi:hypothetical protein